MDAETMNLNALTHKLSSTFLEPNTSHWVYVTHINSPTDFYIRPTFAKQFLNALEKKASLVEEQDLYLYKMVIINSNHLRRNVRGMILDISLGANGITCEVMTIDYGIIEPCVPIEMIYEMHCNINVPPLAIHCSLFGYKPRNEFWTTIHRQHMAASCSRERVHMTIRGKSCDKLYVNIDSISGNVGLLLLNYGHTSLTEMKCPSLKAVNKYIKYQDVSIGEQLIVIVSKVLSSNEFYALEKYTYRKLATEKKLLTQCIDKEASLHVEDFVNGCLVGVFKDEYYERAVIQQILHGSKAVVKFIDQGTDEEMHLANMKPLNEESLKLPAAAVYCSIKGQSAELAPRYLNTGQEITIEIKHLGNNKNIPHTVDIVTWES